MSEFDKEAEREKLREKYANEQKDRESTQRMSDLLLQGATMTNKHCDRCGDPIFRYEGQEFCASCQAAGQAADGAADTGGRPDQGSSDPAETTPESEAAARAVADEERSDPVDTGSQPSEVRETEPEEPSPTESRELPTETRSVSTGGDLSGAREELGRTIATLARRAADAEDPRRAREFLEAADEAAETLATLNGR
ncbi:Sjogren's syndrome/scleroderma autoantigen 1 family protein [Halalkalicoccus sp. NIPERK01]|uniref:Sjogren's syndrome/scleroderma autoantigen 1 family protein n=1 Tax=Halalkalicoccus sp. NIPERK01 TaxID=3053469 RepID=UPI00256E9E97|nr:Sjogren's syndrome/scleroderma autoantigen 1 family protein [Halalkalicoccus sp. NIPERK01]MDL5362941.1 Sjogren's syndrome/scleroderma autoantigen 1 family protein [Halalkalicoccus sp. NIPERK01]